MNFDSLLDMARERVSVKREKTLTPQLSNDLLVLPDTNIVEIFRENGCDTILEKIRAEVTSYAYDMSTEAGRKHIAAVAYKVARSKTTLDDLGKTLVADKKKEIALVDAERKRVREYLDALKDEIRKPLTEFEEEMKRKEAEVLAEAARKKDEAEREAAALAERQAMCRREEEEKIARHREIERLALERATGVKQDAVLQAEPQGAVLKTYRVDALIHIKGSFEVEAIDSSHARDIVWQDIEENVDVNGVWSIDDLDTDIYERNK